jgi:hypothetical protein
MKKWANELNRVFAKKEVQMAKKHMKKCSPYLAIKEMQIKTMLRFLLTTNNNKCWQGCEEKGILIQCHWKCKLVQPLWKTVWRLLKKLKIYLPYDPAIPLQGIYPMEYESAYNKNTCTPMFAWVAALFITAKLWKQPRCPTTDEWIKKIWYLYTMEFYLDTKEMKFCHLQVSGWNWRTAS